jgi:hypothetical protein
VKEVTNEAGGMNFWHELLKNPGTRKNRLPKNKDLINAMPSYRLCERFYISSVSAKVIL